MNDIKTEAIATAIAEKIVERLQRHDRIIREYLTPAQVAVLSGFSEKALENLRSRRMGPRYFKVRRSVRYRYDDIRAWLEHPTNVPDPPSQIASENSVQTDRRRKATDAR